MFNANPPYQAIEISNSTLKNGYRLPRRRKRLKPLRRLLPIRPIRDSRIRLYGHIRDLDYRSHSPNYPLPRRILYSLGIGRPM